MNQLALPLGIRQLPRWPQAHHMNISLEERIATIHTACMIAAAKGSTREFYRHWALLDYLLNASSRRTEVGGRNA